MNRLQHTATTVCRRTCAVGAILLFVAVMANAAASDTSSSNLRKQQQPQESYPRESVIRRLYGPENGQVRKHVRQLEEQSYRSQTGFLGDPNHKVPYENHPYDPESPTFAGRRKLKESENRELQDETEYVTDPNGDGTTTTNLYKPLRIKFETQALDDLRTEETAAKIDFIKTEVLPKYVAMVLYGRRLFFYERLKSNLAPFLFLLKEPRNSGRKH